MKNRVITGIVLMLAGLLYIMVPHLILPVCGHVADTPFMKCFWTARAELGLGIVVIWGGLLLLLMRALAVRTGVCLVLLAVTVLAASLPLGLIGMCRMADMPCRAGTLPALVLLSILLCLFLLGNLFYLRKLKGGAK